MANSKLKEDVPYSRRAVSGTVYGTGRILGWRLVLGTLGLMGGGRGYEREKISREKVCSFMLLFKNMKTSWEAVLTLERSHLLMSFKSMREPWHSVHITGPNKHVSHTQSFQPLFPQPPRAQLKCSICTFCAAG